MVETRPPDAETTSSSSEGAPDPWDDVVRDFQSLGQSISRAIQDVVHDEGHKESLKELRQGLENVADQVAQSINEATRSSEAERMKSGVQRAVDDVRDLGSKVYRDTRPVLITALESLSAGLQRMVDRLQETEAGAPQATAGADDEEAETR